MPVEVGAHYMAPGWSAGRLTHLGAFLAEHMPSLLLPPDGGAGGVSSVPPPSLQPGAPVAYLAQHRLFEQVPALAHDVCVPDYCGLRPPPRTRPGPSSAKGSGPVDGVGGAGSDTAAAGVGGGDEDDDGGSCNADGDVAMHAWLGPAGTVSCLHTDAPHNLLAQVLGCKRVLLALPSYGGAVYPHPGLMRNTSQVDPEVHWRPEVVGGARAGVAGGGGGGGDGAELPAVIDQRLAGSKRGRSEDGDGASNPFPAFPRVPMFEAYLRPGDMLYIPPGWWHHVRALSPSFSVSFWWG